MMTLTISGPTSTFPKSALQSSIESFTHQGFSILSKDLHSAVLTGPGMNSTKQNPLVGASKVSLRVQGHTLQLDAELGGVEKMRRFLFVFPFALGLTLGLIFVGAGLTAGMQFPEIRGWHWSLSAVGGSLLPVSPWLVISPLMANMIRRRTETALRTVVHNAEFASA